MYDSLNSTAVCVQFFGAYVGHERAWRASTRRDELLRYLDLLDSNYRTEPEIPEYLASMVLVYFGR